MLITFTKCHGSGNDFPLIDGREIALSDAQWASLARTLAFRSGPLGGDGVLVLVGEGMRMFNSDGSEAETCLNGLRCVARAGFEAWGVESARMTLKTSFADVARVPDLAPGVYTVRTTVGPNSTRAADVGLKPGIESAIDAPIPGLPSERRFTAVAMPNPHLVTFVDAVDEAELVALGEWCEAGPALIPARANISFVEVRGPDALFVRTFERGVGLTNSCGSAMAASVLSAALAGHVPFGREVRVFNKGGMVIGMANENKVVTISGNATFEWDGEIDVDLEAEQAGEVRVIADRPAEREAWARLVAGLGV